MERCGFFLKDYYMTEPGKNYYRTLLDVHEYAVSASIPYRHVLLDSWWYWKGDGDGVTTWTARPDIFPDGILPLVNRTGWAVVGHNRFWAADTPYAKQNGGKYDFIIEPDHNKSIPVDQVCARTLLRALSPGCPPLHRQPYQIACAFISWHAVPLNFISDS